jgi:PKD repeat protein
MKVPVALSTGLAGLIGLTVFAPPVSAAPVTNQQAVPVASSTLDLGGFVIAGPIILPTLPPLVLTNLMFTANATWSGNLTTNVGWESDSLRQGANFAISRSVPVTSGNIAVTWQVSGDVDGSGFGPINFSQNNVNCAPTLSGGGFSCSGTSDPIAIPGAVVPSLILTTVIEAKVAIAVSFDVTPQNAVVNREFTIGGADVPGPSANPGTLALADTPNTETFTLPCTSSVGDAVNYNLSNYDWAPATSATQQTVIKIINTGPFGADAGSFQIGPDIDIGPAEMSNPAFDLTGTGFLTAMGPLLANNVSPTIDPLGPFSGTEGSPVQFSATTHSQCPIDSYVWQFSDGTTSFGPTPQRAFGDEGTYSGQLTVTDVTGLSAVQDFTVNVADTPPVPSAGPNTSAAWGVPIAFNGQAFDPGWLDQPTLNYAWNWGDGTPGTGGASVSHTYTTPGVYTATLTVCDEDPSCAPSQTTVTVNKRSTITAYTGPLSSLPSKNVTLTASVVDQFAQPVVGRTVNFQLGTQSISATTNGSGVATATIKLIQKKSIVNVSASFSGDSMYTNSSNTLPFKIG